MQCWCIETKRDQCDSVGRVNNRDTITGQTWTYCIWPDLYGLRGRNIQRRWHSNIVQCVYWADKIQCGKCVCVQHRINGLLHNGLQCQQ